MYFVFAFGLKGILTPIVFELYFRESTASCCGTVSVSCIIFTLFFCFFVVILACD